jgi:hypothetical protein
VAVVDQDTVAIPCAFSGLAHGRFQSAALAGRSAKHLILAADPARGAFPDGAGVMVEWGRRKKRVMTPEPAQTSYYGMDSDWI